MVGNAGGLQFNLIWDSSVSAAPAGFESAAIDAALLYTQYYSNPEVINVHIGYGEVDGYALGQGALGESMSYGYLDSYSQVLSNGKTNLGQYNNPRNGGDASDWIPTLRGDSYGSGYAGYSAVVSPTDIFENAVLGYHMMPSTASSITAPQLA